MIILIRMTQIFIFYVFLKKNPHLNAAELCFFIFAVVVVVVVVVAFSLSL